MKHRNQLNDNTDKAKNKSLNTLFASWIAVILLISSGLFIGSQNKRSREIWLWERVIVYESENSIARLNFECLSEEFETILKINQNNELYTDFFLAFPFNWALNTQKINEELKLIFSKCWDYIDWEWNTYSQSSIKIAIEQPDEELKWKWFVRLYVYIELDQTTQI